MSPGLPARDITLNVPRHNTQRIGPKLTDAVETFAKEQKIKTDLRQAGHEPGSPLAAAVESASEWNSLLTTARADRGPQWDVGTQQFHVEVDSELFYDPSPLREHLKEEEEPPSTSKRHDASHPPSNGLTRTPSQAHMYSQQTPYGMNGGGLPGGVSPSPRGGQFPGGNQFNTPIPPNQFYGAGGGRDTMPGMGNMGGMGQVGVGGSPMMARGGGGGMNMGGMGMGMGMSMDGLGISPDIRRRM